MAEPIRQALERLLAVIKPKYTDPDEIVAVVRAMAAARAALAAEPPAPDPREALAARPLLEAVARLGDCIGQHTVGEIATISDRAAAWLAENPPGQPVAIEPRGCPTPGACSCVEAPAPADPSDFQTLQGIALDMVESLRPIVIPEILGVLCRAIKQAPAPAPATDGAARLRQCPTHGHLPANAWGCPECLRELREELARLRATAADGVAAPTPEDLRRWWRETGLNDFGPTPEMLLIANAWASSWAARCAQPIPQPVPVADGEREELIDWLDSTGELAGGASIEEAKRYWRAAALLREARPQPVPVAARPWERPGWCDAKGRCWWFAPTEAIPGGFRCAGWSLYAGDPADEDTHCLPHWAIAIPQPPQGGEVEA